MIYRSVRQAGQTLVSCPTLSDPMDCRLPGSSAHGIFQARVLEWVATAFSDTQHKNIINRKFTSSEFTTETSLVAEW